MTLRREQDTDRRGFHHWTSANRNQTYYEVDLYANKDHSAFCSMMVILSIHIMLHRDAVAADDLMTFNLHLTFDLVLWYPKLWRNQTHLMSLVLVLEFLVGKHSHSLCAGNQVYLLQTTVSQRWAYGYNSFRHQMLATDE